jgi:hypothetical protein
MAGLGKWAEQGRLHFLNRRVLEQSDSLRTRMRDRRSFMKIGNGKRRRVQEEGCAWFVADPEVTLW